MKKIGIVICFITSLWITGCTTKEEPISNTQLANPFSEVTLDEAIQEAGFPLVVPDSVAGYENRMVLVMKDTIIKVLYYNGESFDTDLVIVKAKGTKDASGDYNTYEETNTESIDSREITFKGNDGKIFVAIWNEGDYGYAIDASLGISKEEMLGILQEIQ